MKTKRALAKLVTAEAAMTQAPWRGAIDAFQSGYLTAPAWHVDLGLVVKSTDPPGIALMRNAFPALLAVAEAAAQMVATSGEPTDDMDFVAARNRAQVALDDMAEAVGL